ncbi:uncharacterized protein B0H18DRAFT_1085644 [Fomitopsis serialis]|uniref:uncharacterized protein n=1 Tax=Fomitopsis serialis TaxID=139415 RepID=UPI002008B6E2|nr:uncharacterized protein B0H18DRAFT_1085644 [Neoantrodia serialis]KAH9923631.1 hypothetical protein B0H18DRAFT_1085644 [Neoantrodia serialis]
MATPTRPRIWWANGSVFVAIHLATALGCYSYPYYAVSRYTLLLSFLLFQMAELSITVGYHRLYSHRAFRASLPVRIVVALLGASAMQGSIKDAGIVVLRLVLTNLLTRYAATRGFWWAHMGWIFFKPRYERLELIDQADLVNDPGMSRQHRHAILAFSVPLAVSLGLVLPPCIGALWGEPGEAFVWSALVARLLIWHCTFFVNSLAHWDGLQPYSDENTSKSNLFLALLTCGEGNHNFHAFPHDYRSGPAPYDWDPSKWMILLLKRLEDVSEARFYMLHKHAGEISGSDDSTDSSSGDDTDLPRASDMETWTLADVNRHVDGGRCVVVLDGFVVDVTGYLGEHPGGAVLLRKYSVRSQETHQDVWKQADWAFHGGMNIHSRAARRRMRQLRVARLVDGMQDVTEESRYGDDRW